MELRSPSGREPPLGAYQVRLTEPRWTLLAPKPGGGRGIRTPGRSHVSGFQDRRLRPLGHSSTINYSGFRLLFSESPIFRSQSGTAGDCGRTRGRNSETASRRRQQIRNRPPVGDRPHLGSPDFGMTPIGAKMVMDAAATPSAALDGYRGHAHDSFCLSRQGSHCRAA